MLGGCCWDSVFVFVSLGTKNRWLSRFPILEFVAFCASVRCRFLFVVSFFFFHIYSSFHFLFSWDEGGEEDQTPSNAVPNTNELPG